MFRYINGKNFVYFIINNDIKILRTWTSNTRWVNLSINSSSIIAAS